MTTQQRPRYAIARPPSNARQTGVLPGPGTATSKSANASNNNSTISKTPSSLKIIVRRLPPGLIQSELLQTLGTEWHVGGGKVDWMTFKAGKVSKDPAKSSRPAYAVLHLTKEEYLAPFSNQVREKKFVDALLTAGDPALLGPPSFEFAPYARVPGGRVRNDARQGTIDQDPEFIEFLESLTNPPAKSTPLEQVTATEIPSKEPVITPLIQFLREKKANKVKESASSLKGKQGKGDKEAKNTQHADKKTGSTTGNSRIDSTQVEKSARDTQAARDSVVKAANRQAAAISKKANPAQQTTASSPAPSPKASALSTPPSAAAVERKRERGNASAAARILQRDLGIGSPTGGRRRRENSSGPVVDPKTPQSSATVDAKASVKNPASNDIASTPQMNQATITGSNTTNPKIPPSKQPLPPTGPASLRATPKQATKQASSANTRGNNITTPSCLNPPLKATPSRPEQPVKATPMTSASSISQSSKAPTLANIATTSTQAFLKHANPSQGITEQLLTEAFTTLSCAPTKVEIDKKKGFAYIDFKDSESLRKAMAASPVAIAQGSVVVLERKTGNSVQQGRNNRGGGAADGVSPVARSGGTAQGGRGAQSDRGGGAQAGPSAPVSAGRGSSQSHTTPRGRGSSRGGRGGMGKASGHAPIPPSVSHAPSATAKSGDT
ncbi:hypothetical protein MMC25_003554 [Agyrium rufum]|nr:hypothetical protein [Agyrium rufum]